MQPRAGCKLEFIYGGMGARPKVGFKTPFTLAEHCSVTIKGHTKRSSKMNGLDHYKIQLLNRKDTNVFRC